MRVGWVGVGVQQHDSPDLTSIKAVNRTRALTEMAAEFAARWHAIPPEKRASIIQLLPSGFEETSLQSLLNGEVVNFHRPVEAYVARKQAEASDPGVSDERKRQTELLRARSAQLIRQAHDERLAHFHRIARPSSQVMASLLKSRPYAPAPEPALLTHVVHATEDVLDGADEARVVPADLQDDPLLPRPVGEMVGTVPIGTMHITSTAVPDVVPADPTAITARALGVGNSVTRQYRQRRRMLTRPNDDSDMSPSDDAPEPPTFPGSVAPPSLPEPLVLQTSRASLTMDPERFAPMQLDPSCYQPLHARQISGARTKRGRLLRRVAVDEDDDGSDAAPAPVAPPQLEDLEDHLTGPDGAAARPVPPRLGIESRLFGYGKGKLTIPEVDRRRVVAAAIEKHGTKRLYRIVRRRHRHAFARLVNTVNDRPGAPPTSASITVSAETLRTIQSMLCSGVDTTLETVGQTLRDVKKPGRFLMPAVPDLPLPTPVEAIAFVLLAQTGFSATIDDIVSAVRRLPACLTMKPADMTIDEYAITALHLMASPEPSGRRPWAKQTPVPTLTMDGAVPISLDGPTTCIDDTKPCSVVDPLLIYDYHTRRWRFIAPPSTDVSSLGEYFIDMIADLTTRGTVEVTAPTETRDVQVSVSLVPGKPVPHTIPVHRPEVVAQFQAEEIERFLAADKPFVYVIEGRRYLSPPLKKGRGQAKNVILADVRPAQATIQSLVRDAVARLPDGYGTKYDIVALVRQSQWFASNVGSEAAVLTAVGPVLEKMGIDWGIETDADRGVVVDVWHNRLMADFPGG